MIEETAKRPHIDYDRPGHSKSAAPGQAWIAVNTKPHEEERALEHLQRQDFQTYCPMIAKRVRHARYARQVKRPLFPSYLFVRHDRDGMQFWRPIVSTAGVRDVVRFGQRLGFLEDGFIEALKSREIGGLIYCKESDYRLGQKVQIEGGAFDGLAATIIGMDEKDRLVLLMELLNRQVKVKVDAKSILPL
ncbi:MAG TPA: transcriptional activator RfaH [Hyphomicrobiales bacterium]|nr:transcriptional activator RfaH [Hyphomicrobiales bacterium]